MQAKIVFENIKIKKKLQKLDNKDKQQINKALDKLEENAFSAIQIQKRLFPRQYKQLDNLWKHNLPNGKRLIYTVKRDKENILVIILGWFNHKEYEKIFKY